MADSSPAYRRSVPWSSPQRSVLSDMMSEDRNSEARHKALLDTAKREHDRVREEAERVYRAYLEEEERKVQEEERKRILEEKRKEEERIRREEQLAAERTRLHALRAKKVEIPPPPPPEAPRPSPAPVQAAIPAAPKDAAAAAPPTTTPKLPNLLNGAQGTSPFSRASAPGVGTSALQGASKPANPSPFGIPKQPAAVQPPQAQVPQSNGLPQSQIAQQPPAAAVSQRPDRYTIIFQNLKVLRKGMQEQAKSNPALKSRMGDMRREVKKCIGQLVGGAPGVNRQQTQKITSILKEALINQVNSQPIDPSNFLLEPRQPTEGAVHNDPMMPSIFIYLLNIVAKAAIAQYINEAGPKPEAADPVGIVIAATYSDPDFHWRGASFIDIIIAKFRVTCPVLFGYRGNETKEGGRAALGWRKENGRWVPEQTHIDRMQGLGAGFASIALRNFGKSKKKNPCPPRHYWTALAKIVNTPPAEVSNTQCVVLKSMIANFEQKFLEAYGTAAVAAMRTALIDFPARIPNKTSAVASLTVHAQLISKDYGLSLA